MKFTNNGHDGLPTMDSLCYFNGQALHVLAIVNNGTQGTKTITLSNGMQVTFAHVPTTK